MSSLRQVAKAIGILLLATLCVAGIVTVLVVALDFVLLIFLGILFSVFLTKTSQIVNRYLPIGYGWGLALVTSVLLLTFVGGFALLGNKVHDQLQSASQRLDEGMDEFAKRLHEHPWAVKAFKRIPFAQELVLDGPPSDPHESKQTESKRSRSNQAESKQAESKQAESKQAESKQAESKQAESKQAESKQAQSSQPSADSASEQSPAEGASGSSGNTGKLIRASAGKVFSILDRVLSTTLGLVANVGLIFFVGIFIAVDPTLYRDGFARLFPLERRERVADILDRMSATLFSWLMGRFMAMLLTGAGTAAALFVLGVPMAVTVGVITGLLTFVPNIGAIVGLVLAVLMALPQGMATVGWVVGLYAAVQLLESNVITPLVQQHQTAIPPALLLAFQVIMGAVAGFLGLMVASPLLAALLILIEQAWIKDVLGEPANET